MKRKITIWSALANGVLLESIRRKDLYVVAILGLMIIAGAGAVGFFGVRGIEVFAKDLGFGVIGIFSTLLCILIASRQLPEEIKQRTLYPLLSRPITRLDFLIGKFLGAYFVSALAFLLLLGVGYGAIQWFHISIGPILWQYTVCKLLGLFMLTGITLSLSLFTTPSANVAICCILTFGGATISRGLSMSYAELNPLTQWLAKLIYYMLPHIDLFDMSKKVAYGWQPVDLWVIGALAVYAIVYAISAVSFGWLKFNRQAV